jgi:hypothetical protein
MTGWVVYGFAADGEVAVDVVIGGQTEPAMMLPSAYVASLGSHALGDATALFVHYADGTSAEVPTGLQTPGP